MNKKQIQVKRSKPLPNVLSGKDLLSTKETSSLLICGTGKSILDNKKIVSQHARTYDSIGIDWFCKSGIQTKYYFIRDQAHHASMISHSDKETMNEFVRLMNAYYLRSYLIISRLDKNEFDDYSSRWNWGDRYKMFKGKKFIAQESRAAIYKEMKQDFTKKIYRYSYDLFCVLQFAVTMNYESIILAGFELNDNQCFWQKGIRNIQKKRDIDPEGEFVDFEGVRGMLNFYKNNFRKQIYTIDKDSRLLDNKLVFYVG